MEQLATLNLSQTINAFCPNPYTRISYSIQLLGCKKAQIVKKH